MRLFLVEHRPSRTVWLISAENPMEATELLEIEEGALDIREFTEHGTSTVRSAHILWTSETAPIAPSDRIRADYQAAGARTRKARKLER